MNASASPDLAHQAPPAEATPREGLFINRNFFLLWLGQTGSVFGDFVFNTTLVVWIAASIGRGQSWAPLAVSGVFIAASAPAILVAPWAGALVDRMGKRGVIVGAYAASLAITLALIPATGLLPIGPLADFHPATAWILGAIYIAVAGLAACMQFSSPASLALIGQIVSEPSRPRAMGFMQGSMSLGMLVGPALAAPLLLAFGAQWALLIDAASFAVGLATLLAMRLARSIQRAAQHERQSLGREIIEGISFTVRTRTLRVLALVMGVAMLGAGAINALDVFFTTHNLHTSLDLYGLLSTTFGIGLIIGAILTGALAQRVGLARTLWVSTALTGALLIAYARLNSFGAAAIMLLVMGIPMAGIDVAGGPLLLRETPERLVGRVSSIITPIGTVATLAGAALAGYADSAWLNGFSARAFGMAFGPVDTIFAIGGALILIGGLYALVGLRGADRRARLAAARVAAEVAAPAQEG